jgi:hypothetical protein
MVLRISDPITLSVSKKLMKIHYSIPLSSELLHHLEPLEHQL